VRDRVATDCTGMSRTYIVGSDAEEEAELVIESCAIEDPEDSGARACTAPRGCHVSSAEATPGTLELDSGVEVDSTPGGHRVSEAEVAPCTAPGGYRVSSAEATPKTLELDSGAKVDARLLAGARSETNSIGLAVAPGSMQLQCFQKYHHVQHLLLILILQPAHYHS
jgi:hypothetical protein